MKWISVKDKLPEEDQTVVFVEKNGSFPCLGIYNTYNGIGEWYIPAYDDAASSEFVTHWMPLPEPPKQTK